MSQISTSKKNESASNSEALEWIHLELFPLPDQVENFNPCIVWWNPQSGEIVGEFAEKIIALIQKQLVKGSVTNSLGTIELSDPFTKPTQLASVLGQYYWVVPVPVAKPYEKVESVIDDADTHGSAVLH